MRPASSSGPRPFLPVAALFAVFLGLPRVAVADTPVPRTNLTDPSARCMDGTLGAYYHRPAENPADSTRWAFFLEGGGECTTKSLCDAAVNTTLGSSRFFPSEQWLPYFLADDAASNPDFFGWNHVLIPYCSQDLWSGTVTKPSDSTFGFYFSGHLILSAVVDALVASAGLGSATEIILSGASAGGIGTWINADWLASRLAGTRVSIVSIAGFYFYAYPYTGVNHTSSALADFRPQAWPATYKLWQSYADEDCVQDKQKTTGDPWACLLSNYSRPYVSSPAFIAEAQTDEVVTTAHDWLPFSYRHSPPEQAYLGQWQANMTQALSAFVLDKPPTPQYGAFFPSCFIHTDFNTTSPLINGWSYLDALGSWYFNRTTAAAATSDSDSAPWVLADDCGVTCNPTCQH